MPLCLLVDIQRDTTIDTADFLIWKDPFGEAAQFISAATTVVLQPGTCLLLIEAQFCLPRLVDDRNPAA